MNNNEGKSTTVKKKITWIVIMQGLTMLLVVLGHSDLGLRENIKSVEIMYRYNQPFRMPLFLLISGYLFYLTRINKDKTYNFVVVDKLKRLGIPFLFFTFFTLGIKILTASLIKNPLPELTLVSILSMLVGLETNPLGALWFVQVTFLLMLLYPLYKYIFKYKWLVILSAILVVLLHYYPIPIKVFLIDNASSKSVYFFFGMLICRYRLDKYVKPSFPLLLMWVTINTMAFLINRMFFQLPDLLMAFIGITMCFHFAKTSEKYCPNIFSSFRNNTYQIYLLSIFPQMAFEIIYRQIGNMQLYPLFFVVNIFVGIYFPILMVKILQRLDIKWMKTVCGLA